MPEEYSSVPANSREIPGCAAYRVDVEGNVWTCRVMGHIPGRLSKTWRRLTLRAKADTGHIFVNLQVDRKPVRKYVHRLVLEAFVGPCPEGQECRHFPDRNPANNRLGNLQWGTCKENAADKAIHGTQVCGERQGLAKFTDDDIRSIRADYATGGWTQKQLAERFRVDPSSISYVVNRKIWRHVL